MLTSDYIMDYQVSRMYHWLGVTQYVLKALACSAALVMSERAFSTAAGFVTEKLILESDLDHRGLLNSHFGYY